MWLLPMTFSATVAPQRHAPRRHARSTLGNLCGK
jgi:hypothetical protein